jgi:hypothetical protein
MQHGLSRANPLPPIALGEIKSERSYVAGLYQLSGRGQVSGLTALVTYDYSGRVRAQIFQSLGTTSHIVFEGYVGQLRQLPTARPGTGPFGNAIEPHIRHMIEQATGLSFRPKSSNEGGVDLVPR